jgi:glycopeptide antibiotics resistance protein
MPNGQLLSIATFCVYLAAVAALTVLPIVLDRFSILAMRADGTRFAHGINLVPLNGISHGAYSTSQVIGNFLLGIPFGFGLPFVGVRSSRAVLGWGLLFALGIEGAQLAFDVAYRFAFRVVDINDVLLNFGGVAAGLLIFLILSAPWRWFGADRGRSSYLREVLSARRSPSGVSPP